MNKRFIFKSDELGEYFNKVEGMTAICRSTRNWLDDYSGVLKVGKTYRVTQYRRTEVYNTCHA